MAALFAAVGLLGAAFVAATLTSPRPDLGVILDQAGTLVEAGEHREALGLLNDHMAPELDESLPRDVQRRFHLLRARALYLGQKAEGLDIEANHRNILGEYAAAAGEAGLASLEARDVAYIGDTHISLGELAPALEALRSLPAEERERRSALVRRIVERKLAGPAGNGAGTAILLADLLDDPSLDPGSRAWVVARQAEMLLASGHADEAVAKILRVMPRVVNAERAAVGELFLLLGSGYLDLGAVSDAAAQLARAEELFEPGDGKRAQAMLLHARIAEAEGDLAAARARYAAAAQGEEPVRTLALTGLAEVQAAAGDTAESIETYTTLVRGMPASGAAREAVRRSLLLRHGEALTAGKPEDSLKFAELAEQAGGQSATAEVMLALAVSHRTIAEGLLGPLLSGPDRVVELARMEPVPRERARRALREAGRCFLRHADLIAGGDHREYSESLWLAADSFDRSGEREKAITTLSRFVAELAADPRQAEARFRLGQACQASGDYVGAADYYRSLIESAADGKGAGPFADASFVPLAQTYLADADASNDAEAERLLAFVVEGNIGGTATASYRDAIWELARLRTRQGRHAEAIDRLEELLARAPDHPRVGAVRYDLADACRQEAAAIARTLETALPEQERRKLETARAERLRRASELFEAVRASLEREDRGRITPLQARQLRNSWFFLADCAFDLGDYETARRLYDAARERFPDDPASLVAMIQIVNAYLEEGDLERAATANERARRFYESLPAHVWEDPELPIDRQDWQRWLDSIAALMPRPAERVASPEEPTDEL